VVTSGVVEGNAVPPNILWRTAVPPNDISTRGERWYSSIPQVGLQRNAKSMVSWFLEKSLKLLPPDKEGERRAWERRRRGLPSVPTVPNLPLHHWWSPSTTILHHQSKLCPNITSLMSMTECTCEWPQHCCGHNTSLTAELTCSGWSTASDMLIASLRSFCSNDSLQPPSENLLAAMSNTVSSGWLTSASAEGS